MQFDQSHAAYGQAKRGQREEVFAHRLGEPDPTPFPNVERLPVTYAPNGRMLKRIPGHHALYDTNTDQFFSIVSPQYQIVPHQDVCGKIEEVMDSRGLKPEIRTDFVNGGAMMKRTYTFKDEKYDIGDGDKISPSLYFFNSYDKKMKLRLDLGAFRWVCSNGMVSGESFYRHIAVHKTGSISFNREDLDKAFDKFSDQIDTWSEWRNQEAKIEDLVGFMAAAKLSKAGNAWIEREILKHGEIQKNDKDLITGIPAMSYWMLYNIFTAYTTHQIQSLRMRTQVEAALRSQLRN